MSLDQLIAVLLSVLQLPIVGVVLHRIIALEAKVVPPAEADKIKSIVRSAVMAVEQTCSAMQGSDKKSEATRLVGTLLNEHGLKVSPTMLDTLVEQAVLLINQGQDPQQTAVVPIVKP